MTSNSGAFYVQLFRPSLWSYFKDFQKRLQLYIFWGCFWLFAIPNLNLKRVITKSTRRALSCLLLNGPRQKCCSSTFCTLCIFLHLPNLTCRVSVVQCVFLRSTWSCVWGSRRVVAFVHSIQLFSRASKANPKTRPVYYPSSSNHSAPDLSEAVVTKVFTEALRQPTVPTTTTSNQHSSAAKAHYP